MEVSIVSTSLITISNDLDGYSQSSWIITSYLLTFTGGHDGTRDFERQRLMDEKDS
jgi:hypothetical protein